jgi:hypothetical protein
MPEITQVVDFIGAPYGSRTRLFRLKIGRPSCFSGPILKIHAPFTPPLVKDLVGVSERKHAGDLASYTRVAGHRFEGLWKG